MSKTLRASAAAALLAVILPAPILPAPLAMAQDGLGGEVVAAANKLIEDSTNLESMIRPLQISFQPPSLKEGNLQSTLDWLSESTDDLTIKRNQIIAGN